MRRKGYGLLPPRHQERGVRVGELPEGVWPMPSKNMIPKGQRHHSVRAEYVATRFAEPEMPVEIPVAEFDEEEVG